MDGAIKEIMADQEVQEATTKVDIITQDLGKEVPLIRAGVEIKITKDGVTILEIMVALAITGIKALMILEIIMVKAMVEDQ